MTISPRVNSEGWKATIESLVLIYKPITPAQIVMAMFKYKPIQTFACNGFYLLLQTEKKGYMTYRVQF